MKTAFLVISITVTICLVRVHCQSEALKNDLQEFVPLIPRAKLGRIVAKHYAFDRKFRKAVKFVRGNGFKPVWDKMIRNREFRDIVQYLDSAGLDTPAILDNIASKLNLSNYPRETNPGQKSPRTLMTFTAEVIAALPRKKFSNLIKRKLQTSPDFKTLYLVLADKQLDKRLNLFYNSPDMASAFKTLSSNHINLKQLVASCQILLDWGK